MTHTPGPWEVHKYPETNGYTRHIAAPSVKNRGRIAQVFSLYTDAGEIANLRRKVFQYHRWDDAGMLGPNGYGPLFDTVLRGARLKAANGRDALTDPYFGREFVA